MSFLGRRTRRPIRIGLAGAGWVATNRHLPVLKRDRRVEIAAVADPRPDRAADAARRFGIARHFDRFEDLLAEALDAVIVCTPPDEHARVVEGALSAGCHVLVEKPMTMSAAEGQQLETLAVDRNLVLCPAHNFLFARSAKRARDLIATGGAGEVRWAMGVQMSSSRRRLPDWFARLPGGLFFDEAPHLLYLMQHFLGDVRVEDAWRAQTRGAGVGGDHIEARLRGGLASAYLTSWSGAPLSEWYLVLCCTEAVLAIDLFRDTLVSLPPERAHDARDVVASAARRTIQLWAGIASTGARTLRGRQFFGADELDRRFIDSVETGCDPPATARDGWRVVALIEEILRRCA